MWTKIKAEFPQSFSSPINFFFFFEKEKNTTYLQETMKVSLNKSILFKN